MKIKKLILLFSLFLIVLVIASFFIPKETVPSSDTRVVLDHTYRSYIAPGCFEESDLTNFLEESTLEQAQKLQYHPHSTCTEDALKPEKGNLFISLLKEVGIINKKWDNW